MAYLSRFIGRASVHDTAGLLKYDPADVCPLSSPTTINIPVSGGSLGSLSASTDYIFQFPNEPVTNGIAWNHGRNIQIIGGQMNLTTGGTSQKYAIEGRSVRGAIYMEGLHIDASTGQDWDLVVVNGLATAGLSRVGWTYPPMYMQNCLFKGSEWGGGGVHPDIVQRQGPMGGFYGYQLTFETEYQGLFLPWLEQSAGGGENYIDGMPIELERVNGYTREERDGYLLWLGWIGQQNASFAGVEDPAAVSLSNVWVEGKSGDTLATNLVFPRQGSLSNVADGAQDIGLTVAADGLSGTWTGTSQITGTIRKGIPTGGHFVEASQCGIGYVSPGYQS